MPSLLFGSSSSPQASSCSDSRSRLLRRPRSIDADSFGMDEQGKELDVISPSQHCDPAVRSVARMLDQLRQQAIAEPAPREDDESPPPPPPAEDDDGDDTTEQRDLTLLDGMTELESSTRSSPDTNYDPVLNALCDNVIEEEDVDNDHVPVDVGHFNGSHSPNHRRRIAAIVSASAEEDEDATSYNGGTTDEDANTDDDEAKNADGLDLEDDSGVVIIDDSDNENNEYDDDDDEDFPAIDSGYTITASGASIELGVSDSIPVVSSRSTSCAHTSSGLYHLDLEHQRAMVEFEKQRKRDEYHSAMQRAVTLGHDQRSMALRALLNEAHRFHRTQATIGRPHIRCETWRSLASATVEDMSFSGVGNVQRNLSCMCIFSGQAGAREYGEHEEERSRRQANQHRTLQALRMQAARGGSPYFLRSPAIAGVQTSEV